MNTQETISYIEAMKRTAEKDKDPRSGKCVEACESVLKLIDERRTLQNRCFMLTSAILCGYCGMECGAIGRKESNEQKSWV